MDYQGHKIRINNGYYDVYYPEHPNARKDGSVMLHVIIAAEILGRPLSEIEVVHHKDFNRLNNDPENLMIFASNEDHMRFHRSIDINCDYILYRINNVYHCPLIDDFFGHQTIKDALGTRKKLCPCCGGLMSLQSTTCSNCYYIKARKVIRPSRLELKHDIRMMPMIKVGEKYGVSDAAIRKWCKQYNLPYHSLAIRKMSSADWKRI